MATVMIPAGDRNMEFVLEQGYLLPSEEVQANLTRDVPSIDLFAQTKGNVSEAVEYLLNLGQQGVGA